MQISGNPPGYEQGCMLLACIISYCPGDHFRIKSWYPFQNLYPYAELRPMPMPTDEKTPGTVTKPMDFTEQPTAGVTSPSSSPGNVSSNGTEI